MPQIPIRAAGIPWYRREDWDELLRLFDDANTLSDSYEKWLAKAETVERQLKDSGHVVVRAYIDPTTFADWCRTRGLNVNSKARTRFANEAAFEQVKRTH